MSMKRQIGLGAFISFLFFAVAFGIFFWFMMRPYKYEGEHPDLYTVAVNNVFGARGYMSNGESVYDPDIEVIEKDSYGRILFFYDEHFSFGTALVIMQAYDENKVSYYLDHCYHPYTYSEDSPYDATYRDLFTEKEISDLKELNDWNKPINGEKCTSSSIVSCKGDGKLGLDEDDFEKVLRSYADTLNYLGNDSLYRYHIYCGKDSCGREIYYVWGVGRDTLGEGVSPDSTTQYFELALIFEADGSCPLTNLYEITEETDLHTDILAFKERVGWNKP